MSKLEPPEDVVNAFFIHYDPSIWDWSKAVQFTQHLVEKYIASLRHIGTGMDGIHNFCSKSGNSECVRYIVRLFDAFTNGEPLPLDINDGLFVFLQKSDRDYDRSLSAEDIYGHPGNLRPLTLKNCDNQCVARICNWIVKPVVETSARSLQNGFTKGTIFLNNVVELDFAARRDALSYCEAVDSAGLSFGANPTLSHKRLVNLTLVLMLFDDMSAFPSVSHAWIFYVLTYVEFPSGLSVLVGKLYASNKAYY